MTRGAILHLTRDQVVQRGFSQVTALIGGAPIQYNLAPGYNGGADPRAPNCTSPNGVFGSADCIGFVLWASGIDRMQPGYKGSRDEWLNCASLLDDADDAERFCRPLDFHEKAKAGDWLLTRDHIGLIVRPGAGVTDELVIDCSPRHGRATAVNTGYHWSDACRIIRPLFYAEAP